MRSSPLAEDGASTGPSKLGIREIQRLREEIDDLNLELLDLLRRRMETVCEIARLKKGLRLNAYDPARETEMLAHLTRHACPPLLPEDVERIFGAIFACGLAVQHREPSSTTASASPANPGSRSPRKR